MLLRSFEVDPADAGERLDRLAARRLETSRNIIQRIIQEGLLRVDGEEALPSYRVRGGERVEARMPEEGLVPEEIPVPVVFEDGYLLVVDKPAGLVVHPGAGSTSGTLVNALLERGIAGGEEPNRPGVVHRLDRDTSGLMVLAKGEPAYSKLVEAMSGRRVRRVYRAVVVGEGLPQTGTVDSPVGRDPDLDGCGGWQARGDTLRGAPGGGGTRDAPGAARDGEDAPDPGPPLGHRTSRLRRPALR